MEQSEIFEQVTALVDNEIKDQVELKKTWQQIDQNPALKAEFLIQSHIKSSLKNRFGSVETPLYLKERIISQILQEIPESKEKVKKAKRSRLFRPVFAFASLAAVIILTFVFFFKSDDAGTIASQQSGLHNMFVQARKNFQSIVDGKLPLEIAGSNSDAVRQFFKDKGVKFRPIVPQSKEWSLIGSVVSDVNGEKLPHNVYKGKEGKLVYLYQANEECLKKKKAVTLSNDLLSMLDQGKSYKYKDGDRNYLVWKDKNNICVLVSNESLEKLESNFLTAGK
ncbi:MAG: hypothetical protein ACM3QX_06160 [Syntrophomonadaceae bacterium]